MRLILAHRHDVAARELAARWGGEALLLTPADLHDERLLLTVDRHGEARAELPSRPEVTSVLSRLGGIGPADLDHVDPQDLGYAAAELDAFLRAWLGAWPGPVVNRPTTTCLNGPGWRPEQWILAAAATGLPVRPARRCVPAHRGPAQANPAETMTRVSVAGRTWFGAVPEETGRTLCALANTAGCVLLEAMLDADGTVLHVGAWPDVSAPDVADALIPILDGASM